VGLVPCRSRFAEDFLKPSPRPEDAPEISGLMSNAGQNSRRVFHKANTVRSALGTGKEFMHIRGAELPVLVRSIAVAAKD
jgi:hypothetical protein